VMMVGKGECRSSERAVGLSACGKGKSEPNLAPRRRA
jgi:hypothetical protein